MVTRVRLIRSPISPVPNETPEVEDVVSPWIDPIISEKQSADGQRIDRGALDTAREPEPEATRSPYSRAAAYPGLGVHTTVWSPYAECRLGVMQSRPPSPSQLRNHVESAYHVPTYNPHAVHNSQTPPPPDSQSHYCMGRAHNSLDILLPSHSLYFRGTGVDVEPCTLMGNLVLNLVEATTFKDITMQFRGKSRVPQVQGDSSSILGANYQTSTIYYHDWSFLEGERKHSPTLKAGRHVFPFRLQLEGWLPSSLSTHGGLGGISYKLRATATRPVFASNLNAAASVHLVRSFATESLEYQQTLELENTWPDKMMYSLMIPYKAWAAGDTITTLAKFSPLTKGVHITSITTTIQEHMKTYTKVGRPHDTTRIIATAKHDIRNGQTETFQLNDPTRNVTISRRPSPPRSAPGSPTLSEGLPLSFSEGTLSMDTFQASPQHIPGNVPTEGGESNVLGLSGSGNEQRPFASSPASSDNIDIGEEEIVATLPILLPPYSTPSHSLEPIVVSHRVRWSVLMTNSDGHISELRCSLPIHILDRVLFEEARLATRATHRLIFGLEDSQQQSPEEFELPSYPAHVLDRVANAYIPPSPIPTSNPLMGRSENDPSAPSSVISAPESMSLGSSLLTVGSHEAISSEPSGTVALDWVNSELHRLSRVLQRPGINIATPPDSTQTSRHASRASSRAASPERGSGAVRERQHQHHNHHSIFSLRPFCKVASSFQGKHHHSGPTSDGAHTSSSMRRFSSEVPTPEAPSGSASPVLPRGRSEDQLYSMRRSFNEVPDYHIASRGFLGGGVTPLSSTRGLPSYEEAERSHSDGDLAARFGAAPTMA